MPKDIILIVDDEPIVLRACSIAIALAGYRTVVAENGAAGLEVFMQLHTEICLVLADIIMPELNGVEMSNSILQFEPQAKILLMSGFSDEALERFGRERFPFIRKPFIYTMLVQKIRATLGTQDQAAAST